MLSPEENFKPFTSEELEMIFLSEIRALDAVTRLPEFSIIMRHNLNYQDFLASRKQILSPMASILEASCNTRIVRVSGMSPAVRELFCTVHFAACSVLLEGFRVNMQRFLSGRLISDMRQFIVSPFATTPRNARLITNRLHGMDAVRTMQLLKAFGLIRRKSAEIYQLGLGAADGSKDIDYVHIVPDISIESSSDRASIKFGSIRQRAADIVINDLDPRYQTRYAQFARDPSSNVTAFVTDIYDLLRNLSRRDIHKRNLVTMLRIEPSMIPDSDEFWSCLCPLLDDSCDFVLSIGAGDSPEAYRQRADMVAAFFEELNEAGLEPVLFKLHLDGTVMQQASSLQFGHAAVSCYEILYCKLDSELMRKTFHRQ